MTEGIERREFDKYFDKMVQMIELNSSGQEKFSSHIDTLTKSIERLIKEIESNEELIRDILTRMTVTSNETLNIELQKIKELNQQLQQTSLKLLEELKDFCDNDNGTIVKGKVDEVLGKVSALDGQIKVLKDKDAKFDMFVKLMGLGLGLFLALFTTFSSIMQSNNTDKIEKAIQEMHTKTPVKK